MIARASKPKGRVGSKKRRRYRRVWSKACNDHYTSLISYAQTLVNGHKDRAEDLIQTVVRRTLAANRNPTDIDNYWLYLRKIVFHEWIRGRQRIIELSMENVTEAELENSGFSPQGRALRNVEARVSIEGLVRNAGIDEADFQQLWDLRSQGFTFEEIAEKRAESVKRTKSLWYEWLDKLKKQAAKKKASAAQATNQKPTITKEAVARVR